MTICYIIGQPPHLATVGFILAPLPSSPNPIRQGHAVKSGGSFFKKNNHEILG